MVDAIPAVYRATDIEPWDDVEIVGHRPEGLVLREVGKLWPGIWVASLDRVRIATSLVLEVREFDGSWQRAA